jgi:glucosamine kinase
MTNRLLKILDCKNDTDLVEVIAGQSATFYAQLANLVFDAADQGDEVAKRIVVEGANYINNIADTLLSKNPPRISMIGGLTPRLKPWLSEDIRGKLSKPLNPPEIGSVLFARQQLALKLRAHCLSLEANH